jgi:hypothetical protein
MPEKSDCLICIIGIILQHDDRGIFNGSRAQGIAAFYRGRRA